MQLADELTVGIVDRRARRARLGHSRHREGPGRIGRPMHPEVRAVAGGGRRRRAPAARNHVGQRVGDAFLVVVGMVNARAGGQPGTDHIAGVAVPAGPEVIERADRGIVELDQRHVGSGARGAEERAGVKLGELPISGLAALGAPGRAAERILVVPEGHQRRRVARVDAAVIGRHEVHLVIVGGVVDQRSGAEGRATGRDIGDRAHLAAPRIVRVEAFDVEVAAAGLGRFGAESAIAQVDRAEKEIDLSPPAGGNGDLDDHVAGAHQRHPELAVVLVVGGGERAARVQRVEGRIDHQLAARRHEVAGEAEVDRARAGRLNPETPEHPAAGDRLPGPRAVGVNRDLVDHGVARRETLLLASLVFEGEPVAVGRGERDAVDLLERRDGLEPGGRRDGSGDGGGADRGQREDEQREDQSRETKLRRRWMHRDLLAGSFSVAVPLS